MFSIPVTGWKSDEPTHTPQGDVNITIQERSKDTNMNQLTPRKGT